MRNFEKDLHHRLIKFIPDLRTNLNLLNIDVSQSTKAHAHGSICLNVNINIEVASKYTVNNYRQVTGMVTGENFAFFIYRHFVKIL